MFIISSLFAQYLFSHLLDNDWTSTAQRLDNDWTSKEIRMASKKEQSPCEDALFSCQYLEKSDILLIFALRLMNIVMEKRNLTRKEALERLQKSINAKKDYIKFLIS